LTSRKSDIYTDPNAAGERCILLCRACLGEPHLANAAMQGALKPPERTDGRGPLNSVVALTQSNGGCVEHPEFIVYKEAQALPEYAIWYTHHECCLCTHCIARARTVVFVCVGAIAASSLHATVSPRSTANQAARHLASHFPNAPAPDRITLLKHIGHAFEDVSGDTRVSEIMHTLRDEQYVYFKMAS